MPEAPKCAGCNGTLVLHCDGSTVCTWYRCPSKGCEHDTYDLRRGVLRYRSGQVVRLAT